MRTRRVDLYDEAQCARAREVLTAAVTLDRPWETCPELAESLVEWRRDDPAQPMEMWPAVDDDGATVGVLMIWLPMQDNLTKAWFVVRVDPAARRRGTGRALVERLVARALEEDRHELVSGLIVPDSGDDVASHPYVQFATAMGFEQTSLEVVRHLTLPVASDLLDGLAAACDPVWRGAYRVETYAGGVPEPLRESLCALMNLLVVDAPTGDVEYEAETLTPARYLEDLRVGARMGQVRLTTVAVDEAGGDVVAYSDLKLPASPNPVVWQDGTYVHREHRGHRLGTAVKVENLRRLQRDHPERRHVTTSNDDTNRWMVDINHALGFEVKELEPTIRRVLP